MPGQSQNKNRNHKQKQNLEPTHLLDGTRGRSSFHCRS